jgi:ADP-heptose:LPS heptosyltransferase
MQHILVLRFNALGDVALTIPVLKDVLVNNPDVIITIATKQPFAFLFENIERLQVLPIDFNITYKGMLGMYRLYKHLSFKKFDAVIDLHDVMRTQILRTLFSFHTPVFFFKKGRADKQAVITTKKIKTLSHTVERYQAPFLKLNLICTQQFKTPTINLTANTIDKAAAFVKSFQLKTLVGLAPFAAHQTKSLTDEKLIEVIEELLVDTNKIILFFAGQAEQAKVDELVKAYPNKIINTHSLRFDEQIACMSYLKYMVCVDSANMHIAALQGVATISFWGATIPELGFAPIPTAKHKYLQTHVACRPCSVFGKQPCTNKIKMACINQIDVQKNLF